MKRYVLGFLFSEDLEQVALLRRRPKREDQQWQRGRLNGIGGGVEGDEESADAMCREFREEAGVYVDGWKQYAKMVGPDWAVDCFWAVGDLTELQSGTDELVEATLVFDATNAAQEIDAIENLPWLIHAALDNMTDGRPDLLEARYL